ncbi:MazG family protein [Pleurocapsa sp. PCC 7327]|nr:nucleoside triphosphate pyrophosphohydrolase [Pleurocapsa sp. PCC 7327]AFY75586.1 MazG family protein [Pleurocapsa sp. PCC 7327]
MTNDQNLVKNNEVTFAINLMSSSQETANQTYQAILEALEQLIKVVARLRSPDEGCPWDLAQTPQTLIPYVIEEAYEVVDAIATEDPNAIAEELGDLLLQVVLQAQIASESGQFTLKEVAQGITQKLIRRHPHVFGDVTVEDAEQVHQNWEKIKAAEKGETPEEFQLLSRKISRYARTLPPLMAGMKISQKAAAAGFEWDNVEGVWEKFEEELAELKEALQTEDKTHQEAELGDVLFTLINIARWYGLDPSEALRETNRRFIQRLSKMETFVERPLTDYTLDELECLWQKAKAYLNDDRRSNNL